MDKFSRFPESNIQREEFNSKINDDKLDTEDLDMSESNRDIDSKSNFKFENLQKVIYLRKRSLIMIIILFSLIILFSYIIPNLLIDVSLKLINYYSIKDKSAIKIFSYLNDICINFSYILSIIVYLQYPLNYSFTYLLSLIISEYVYWLIFIIYGIEREKSKNLKIFFENGSEKPNLQLLKIVVIYFGFWRILKSKKINKKELNKNKKINNIIFLISFFITIIIFLEQIFVEKCSIKSCFVGLFFGLLIYSVIYELMCIQFMKANFFMNYINSNFWFIVFAGIIPLLIIIFMFNNYNDIEDVFEIFNYIPYYGISSINQIDQVNMNRICLKKSLIVFLMISISYGIKYNYDFVNSKKNDNNFYNLSDIVLFNQSIKVQLILGKIAFYIIFGISIIVFMRYINYNYEFRFIYYLLVDVIVYLIFGIGLFGFGIKQMLKPNLDEGRELEDYQDMGISSGSTPKNEGEEEGRL
jgi:hypothetical protein